MLKLFLVVIVWALVFGALAGVVIMSARIFDIPVADAAAYVSIGALVTILTSRVFEGTN